jgi:peptidoglycan hydrolase-like protein with peptidoglycan-binding domain
VGRKNLNTHHRLLVIIFFVSFVLITPFLCNPTLSFAASAESLERMGYVSPSYNLVKKVQTVLIEKGYDPGVVDGLWGPKTGSAIRLFQKDNGLKPTPYLNKETLTLLFSE